MPEGLSPCTPALRVGNLVHQWQLRPGRRFPPSVTMLPAGRGDHHTCRPQETHRIACRPGSAAEGGPVACCLSLGRAASALVRLGGRVLSVPWPGVSGARRTGFVRGDGPVPEQPALSFAGLLRRLRDDAGLTQEELAEAAGLSPRSVSDLERGVNLTARHDTARLLAGALGLTGPQRALFEAAARGRAPAGQVLAAGEGAAAAAATRTLPRDIASFTGREAELALLTGAVTGAAAAGGGGGGDPRDRRDGRDRQDDLRGARGAPAGRRFPGWAVFPAAARATRRGSGRWTRPMRWPACC